MRVLLVLVFTIMLAGVSTAQNRSELEKQRSEIQREIEDVKRSLSQTKKNRKESLGQLALLQKKLRLREAAINNINQQINVIQGNINQSRNEISRLKRELDTLKVQYEKSVVYAYKNRSNYDFLNFIFSAASFNDALKRVEYLKSYRSYREQQSTNIKNTQALLQNKISTLELTRREQNEVLSKQQKEKMVLVEEKKEKDVVVSKLKSREKELSKELSSKQKADNKLRASIKAAIDREIRLARQKALEEENRKKAASPEVTRPAATVRKEDVAKKRSVFDDVPGGEIISDNFEKNRGKLPWPVDKGHIKIGYGTYSIPETKLKGNNPGLTLETEEGSSVKAIFDGDVISVFDVDGESNVIIRHGKYFTTYGRLSSTSVSKGQKVKTGQVVGRASSNEDGNGEIEFLLMEENRKLDPALWIRRR
ncbi:MAG TPA: peptidoglycan DD-metalloendopeptidase family protein [Flavitalea sp.]|nr:peptidoglycan DD-metalloendopeptidase family protein [Flavitalea sp.]